MSALAELYLGLLTGPETPGAAAVRAKVLRAWLLAPLESRFFEASPTGVFRAGMRRVDLVKAGK